MRWPIQLYLLFSHFFPSSFLFAQESSAPSLKDQWMILENELDSLALFNIMDSILYGIDEQSSEFNFYSSFNSNVAILGRNSGIDQNGLSLGSSFYHKKGIFLDFAGYINSGSNPNYNLTTLSIGYMKLLGSRFYINAKYDRWIYNLGSDAEPPSFENSASIASSFNSNNWSSTLDYTYFFGNDQSIRITLLANYDIKIKAFPPFNSIIMSPMGTMTFGNGDVIQLITNNNINTNAINNQLKYLRLLENNQLESYLESEVNNQNITEKRARFIYNQTLELIENPKAISALEYQLEVGNTTEITSKEFGIMNYNLSLPINFKLKNWNLLLSYTYSFPVKLPGESLDLDPLGFGSIAVVYRLPFNK